MNMIKYSTESEILVTTADREQELLQLYFVEGGREVEDYYREEIEDFVEISSRLDSCANTSISAGAAEMVG